MLRRAVLYAWLALGPAILAAQVPAAGMPKSKGPEFDVASIRIIDPGKLGGEGRGRGGRIRRVGGPGTSDPGRFSYSGATTEELLAVAFDSGQGQLICAPCNHGTVDHYEFTATMPPDTTKTQFQAMMQNFLAERFHLAVHHETRSFPGYELVIDKGGPKLKEAAPGEPASKPADPNVRTNATNATTGNITMTGKTIKDLAMQLGMPLIIAQLIQEQNLNLPIPTVVDKTGLTGTYTFSLDFSPPGASLGVDRPSSGLPDLFVALREQLGLRLNKLKDVPTDVVVVDHVDKVPTAN